MTLRQWMLILGAATVVGLVFTVALAMWILYA